MLDIKAILATLAGVVVVGGVGTYVFLENSNTKNQAELVNSNPAISAIEASKTDTSTQSPESGKSVEKSQESDKAEIKDADANKDADNSPQEAAVSSEDPTRDWKMPAFDVLRVEPDGSTVIAGRGQPNTTLKVMNGEEVLNEVKIGSTGDFAVIFDQPLDSGDYQLTLKVEDEDGNALVSEETAIVSVPEDAGGQLLAMVTKPGKASRILAQPDAPVQAAKEDAENVEEKVEIAANTATAENTAEVKKEMLATETEKQAQNSDDVIAVKPTEEIASVSEPSAVNTGEVKTVMKLNNSETPISTEKPAIEKQNITDVAKVENELPVVAEKEASMSENASTMTNAAASKEVEVVKKDVVEDVNVTTSEVVKTAEVDVKVDDVEKIVEASSQSSMEKAPAKIIAEVQPKNNSIVRIEAVEVEGDKLFVAGVASKGNRVRILVDGKEVGAVDVNGEGRFLIETQQELSVGQHMITAALEDKSTKKIVLRAVVPFNRPEAESAAAIADPDVKADVANNDAESQKVENPKEQEIVAANSSDNMTVSKGVESGSEVAKKMDQKPEASMAKVDDEGSMKKDEPQTIVQDTLTPAASQSVIIRKGDTLWQIARRTYGAGVRYTTIYLANQEQIQNPDKIAPGQIFMVPEEALENAEELHQKRLQGN